MLFMTEITDDLKFSELVMQCGVLREELSIVLLELIDKSLRYTVVYIKLIKQFYKSHLALIVQNLLIVFNDMGYHLAEAEIVVCLDVVAIK